VIILETANFDMSLLKLR